MLSIVFKPLDASQGAGLNEAAVQLDVPRTGVLGAQVRAELLSRVELDGCTPYFYVEAADPASEDAGVPSMDASREAGAPGMPTQRALVAVPADVSAEELLRLAGCDGAAPLTVFFTTEQQYGCCVGRLCRIICKPVHCIFRHCCCCCHKGKKDEVAEGAPVEPPREEEPKKVVEVPPPQEEEENPLEA